MTGGPPEPGTSRKALVQMASVLLALGMIVGAWHLRGPAASPPRSKPTPPATPAPVARIEPPRAPVAPPPVAVVEARVVPDRAAVAHAEAVLDASSRDRARAEARAAEAADQLADASIRAAADASAARDLSRRVRDPGARLARASTRGGFLRAERDQLKGEVAAIEKAPRPKAKLLADMNPVARPADGDEFHFELRRNRVAFIDLERLMEKVKTDAKLRIRLADGPRTIASQVGPVGPFSLRYEMSREPTLSVDDLLERGRVSYGLRGWEIVPEFEGRGDTFEASRSPVSDFSRALGRLSPARSTITMWVYPDSFALFRRLRDDLHARGFMVAARPLPEAMTIRGSPSGSLSASQ